MKLFPTQTTGIKAGFTLFLLLFFMVSLPGFSQSNGKKDRKRDQKIVICHIPPGNPDNAHTIEIDESAWEAHASHGDSMGYCDGDRKGWKKADKITICHFPPGNPGNVQVITISEEAWDAHQAHGDSIGDDCEGDDDDDGDDDDGDDDDGTNGGDCFANVDADFSDDALSVTVSSDKDLSHVEIVYCDDVVEKIEDLSGYTMTFEGTGDNAGKQIKGVWIKSGCNTGDNDPGSGQYVANDGFDGDCEEEVTAVLETEDEEICMGDNTTLEVHFTGNGPWTLTYEIENESYEVGGIDSDTYFIPVSVSGLYSLTGISDVDGESGQAIGEVLVIAPPTATLEGDGQLCEGETATLAVVLTGEAPWSFTYTDGDQEMIMETGEAIAYIETSEPGTYTILSVTSGNCSSEVSEQTIEVEFESTSSVDIAGGGEFYAGETVALTFNMEGEGPWTVEYTDGNEVYSFQTDENTYEVDVNKAGEYWITNVEGNGCVDMGETRVTTYELPTAKLTVENPELCVDEEGTFKVLFTGIGPWDLTYSVNGEEVTVTDISTPTFEAAIEEDGTYEMQNVVDANDRQGQVSGSTTVVFAENPFISIEGGGIICPGESTEIVVTLGGEGPWTFTYTDTEGPKEIQSAEPTVSFNATEEGEYRITSIRNSNCSVELDDAVTVLEVYDESTLTLSGGGDFYPGESVPLIFDLTGNGPWEVEYSNGNETFSFTTEDPHYEVMVSDEGTYDVVAFDAGGCSVRATGQVKTYELPTAELVIEDPDICVNEEGLMKVSFTGNGPWDLTYTVDGAEVTIENIATPEFEATIDQGGDYEMQKVVDNNDREGRVSGSSTVTLEDHPFISIDGGGTICPGESTDIIVTLGGEGPWVFTYTDTDGPQEIRTNDPTVTFTASEEGEYRITSITNTNCSVELTDAVAVVEVIDESELTLSGGGDFYPGESVTLNFDMKGIAPWTVTYSDGSEDYTFTTSDSHYEVSVSEVATYNIKAFDAAGCSITASGTVTTYELPTAQLTDRSSILCEGENTSLELSLTGVGPWTVEYSADGSLYTVDGITDPDFVIDNVNGSQFSLVSVTDANQKEGRAGGQVSVDFRTPPSAEIYGGGVLCDGEEAQLMFNLEGTGPWDIVYTNGTEDFEVTTNDPSYSVSVGTAGVYSISSVRDQYCGNDNISSSAEIEIIDRPTATMHGDASICPNETAGLAVNLTGQAPWTLEYTDGTEVFTVSTDDPTYTINANRAGEYRVISVTSAGGCSNSGTGSTLVGTVASIVDLGSVVTENTHCAGTEVFLTLEIPESVNYEVNWTTTGLGTFSATNDGGAIYIPSDEDDNLTFTASVTNECETVDFTAETTIQQLDPNFGIEPDLGSVITNVDYTFTSVQQDADSYTWEFSDDNTTDSGVSADHTFESAGRHEVTLTVTKDDCENSSTILIDVGDNTALFVPSVFNPESSNEENRQIKVFGDGIDQQGFSFEVFNRWGLVVYSTKSLEQVQNRGWDGTRRGEPQENGVYTYVLRGQFKNGESFEKTGTITLVK